MNGSGGSEPNHTIEITPSTSGLTITTPVKQDRHSNPGQKKVQIRHVSVHNLNWFSGGKRHHPSLGYGVAVLANGNKVLTERDSCNIKVFTPKMKLLTTLNLPTSPLNITLFNDNEMIVMARHELYFVEYANEEMTISQSISTEYLLNAATVCEENIYVTCYGVPPQPPSVKKFTKYGTEPTWSCDLDDENQPLFKNPYFITSLNTDDGIRLIVVDIIYMAEKLILIDGRSGEILTSRQVAMENIAGITSDVYNNIFVCYDRSNAISALPSDLSEETVIYKSNNLLSGPRCLSHDKTKDHLLLITSDWDVGNALHVYKISYK